MKKRMIKKIVVAVLSCTAINAYAIGNGFYLGLMMGPATNNASPQDVQLRPPQLNPGYDDYVNFGLRTTVADPRSTQFASRIFMGNKFNTYASVELGVTFISSIKYDAHGARVYNGTDQRVRTLDLVGKGTWPLWYVFDFYAKGGIALTYLTTGGGLQPTFEPNKQHPERAKFSGSNTYTQKFSPTFSIGASYDINQSWVTDLSYNVILVGGNVNRVTYYALSLSYHFTDKFCGQFLCDD